MIALVTATSARHLDEDLEPLTSALTRAGIAHDVEAWDDTSVRWERYELAVIRSTWDYTTRHREFLDWIDGTAAHTTLWNPPAVLRWTTDKHYLADLAAAGVPVVKTTFLEPGDEVVLPAGDLVLKPAIGAGASDCIRIGPGNKSEGVAHAARLLGAGRSLMVQPYVARVDEAGETGLIYIDGGFSHAVRKGPILASEVQLVDNLYAREDITARAPTAAERRVAELALAAVAAVETQPLLYARVDLMPGEEGPLVLELELCEPSLFLSYADGAADRLAAAIGSVASSQ